MFDQASEDRDYEMMAQGSLAMCFSQSQMEFDRTDDSATIHEHRKNGKWCVVMTHDHFCRSTDAFLGATEELCFVADTFEKADEYLKETFGEHEGCGVLDPYPPAPPPIDRSPGDSDEIPF